MMDHEFNVVDEVRKHPGIVADVVAVLAGVGLATILLNQRTGPTRYERIKTRIDPRGWFDAEALRHRFDDIARGVCFLTADDAEFITGSTMSINGGQHMY